MQITDWLNENKRVFFSEEFLGGNGSIQTTAKTEPFSLDKQGRKSTVNSPTERDLSRTIKDFNIEGRGNLDEEMVQLERTHGEVILQENDSTLQKVFEVKPQKRESTYPLLNTTSENLVDEISGEMERISWRYGHGMEEWTNDQPTI